MRKVSKHRVFSCQYVHQKNSVFGHFSRSVRYRYPFHPDPRQRGKTNLYFYLQTSLGCLKRFPESLKGFHKSF